MGGAARTYGNALSLDEKPGAEMIGTTRSRVGSFMNKFRRLGLVSYNCKLTLERGTL